MFKTVTIEVGNVRLLVEVPSNLVASLEKSKEKEVNVPSWDDLGSSLAKALRKTIPSNDRPPTPAQVAYCESISRTLNVLLPSHYLSSQNACSGFIDEYVSDFDVFKGIEKKIHSSLKDKLAVARKIYKGFEVYFILWSRDDVDDHAAELQRIIRDDVVLEHFDVKRHETIQSYIDCFDEYSLKILNGEDFGMKLCIDALSNHGCRPLPSYIAFYVVEAFVDDPTYEDVIMMFSDNQDIESLINSERVYQHHIDKMPFG